MIPHQAHRLAELASSVGEPAASAGNHPVLLDDPGVAWFVECGALDVFLIDNPEGEQRSSPKHVLRAEAGRLVFGMRGRDGGSLAAIAKGLPGSQLRRIQLKQILDRCDDELADQVDVWVSEFTAAVTREIESHPRPGLLLDPGKPVHSLEAEAGCVLSARTGGVFWAVADGAVAYLGTEDPKKEEQRGPAYFRQLAHLAGTGPRHRRIVTGTAQRRKTVIGLVGVSPPRPRRP